MINKEPNRKWYVYLHKRSDNGEIFYVGIGSTKKRATTKDSRNDFWHNVVNKTDYEVIYFKKNLIYEEACDLEIELINKYGRKDLGQGTLVNLTDGGEGGKNAYYSEELREIRRQSITGENNPNFGKVGSENHLYGRARPKLVRQKISKSHLGKKLSDQHKEAISNGLKGKNVGGKSKCAKKVIDVVSGEVFLSVSEACESVSLKYGTLKAMLQGRNPNKTNLEYLENV